MNWLVRASTGGGAALVAMLFVTSVAAGATLVAPYKGAVLTNYNSNNTGGCAAIGKNLAMAAWSPMTGAGHFAEVAGAKSCTKSLAGVGTGSNGGANGEFELAIPIKIATNGAHSVAATWSLSWASANVLTLGGVCPAPKLIHGNGSSYCSAYSDAYIYGYNYLIDTTNGTYFGSSTYWGGASNYTSMYNDTYCYSFTCSYYNSSYGTPGSSSGSISFTWWFNGTMAKSHHYAVVAYIYGSAYASIYGYPNGGYPKSSASAMVNMATLGHGAKLTSITIT